MTITAESGILSDLNKILPLFSHLLSGLKFGTYVHKKLLSDYEFHEK